jgi:hypothetical protein
MIRIAITQAAFEAVANTLVTGEHGPRIVPTFKVTY